MKRFLGGDSGARKLEKLADTEPSGDPTTIVSWNINGVVPRSEKNAVGVRRFLATCGADCVMARRSSSEAQKLTACHARRGAR